MTTLEVLPFILFIVVVVTAVAEHVNVPYPLLLVMAGLLVGFVPAMPSWHPPQDSVLAIFLPPILFSAARLIAWRDIRINLGTIFSLSFVLVVLSATFIAFVLNYFVPQMPFSAALVLGAIVSPTDTVAATAILGNMNVRQHLIRRLEIESLFNDAMGITLYKTALLMVYLGTLNVGEFASQSVLTSIGGIAVGLVFAYFTGVIIQQFLRHTANELPIIMSLVLAYVAYLFAERLGVSPILAVVAAGLFHKRTERTIEAKTRLAETTVWSTFIFFLNGLIFITIGTQLPTYLARVSYLSTSELLLFAFLTIVALLVLRLFWVTVTNTVSLLIAQIRFGKKNKMKFSWPETIITSWAGMRGLVSLALAIAIPETIQNEEIFHFRDLIIFITIITILFNLIVQGLSLPIIVRWLRANRDDANESMQIEAIYDQLTRKALKSIRDMNLSDNHYVPAAIQLVENYYANRMLHMTLPQQAEQDTQHIRLQAEALLSSMLNLERTTLDQMRKTGEISEEMYIKIVRKMDHDEVGFSSYS